MGGVATLCAARTGVAMWRLRRQVFGAALVAVALCLFYFQFIAHESTTTVAVGGAAPSLRQELTRDAVQQLGDLEFSKQQSGNRQERVQFVAQTNEQLQEQQRLLFDKRGEQQQQDNGARSVAMQAEFSSNREDPQAVVRRQEAVQRAMDQLSDHHPPALSPVQQFTPPAGSLMLHIDDSFGNPWGGNYKYNPYGEPVYGKTDRPNYIPRQRVIHFDLKGAPPRMATLKTLIPWLAMHGATALLLEYEDVFPFHSNLANIAALNHYTPTQIEDLLQLCQRHKIEVIPLVQTFGHLEFILKVQQFAHLREVPELPQALCPSRNESLHMVFEMIDQVMRLHPNCKYIHIGCDEVYHMAECELCRQSARENLFLQHVTTVARHVRKKYGVDVIIWDDMLRHVSDAAMRDYHLGELVEPMVWVYAEDVYRFVQPSLWTKYSQVFSGIWAASAFKGAFGEQGTVPNVRRHLDNHLNWLDVMATESPKFSAGFRGLVLTGWQRFDHFAVMCELLPAAMPSLAVNLISVSHGYFNSSLQTQLYSALNCGQTPKFQSWINLDSDPFLWDKFSWCFFPGKQVFALMSRLDTTRRDVDAYIERASRSRAWITPYNRRHNYTSPMRVDEDLEELPGRLHTVTVLVRSAREALSDWYDEWTIGEWVEQHLWPLLNSLETLQREAESMKRRRYWPVRPLPLLPQLAQYGISEPTSNGNSINIIDNGKVRSRNNKAT